MRLIGDLVKDVSVTHFDAILRQCHNYCWRELVSAQGGDQSRSCRHAHMSKHGTQAQLVQLEGAQVCERFLPGCDLDHLQQWQCAAEGDNVSISDSISRVRRQPRD
jgi:hypothetical protein